MQESWTTWFTRRFGAVPDVVHVVANEYTRSSSPVTHRLSPQDAHRVLAASPHRFAHGERLTGTSQHLFFDFRGITPDLLKLFTEHGLHPHSRALGLSEHNRPPQEALRPISRNTMAGDERHKGGGRASVARRP